MIAHGFDVQRGNDLIRVQQRIKDALDTIVVGVFNSRKTIVTFIVNGLNGAGIVTLPPIHDVGTGRILRRAIPGYILIAAANLTDDTDAQSLFEQTVAQFDQIKQLSTTNLSAKRIQFILASN